MTSLHKRNQLIGMLLSCFLLNSVWSTCASAAINVEDYKPSGKYQKLDGIIGASGLTFRPSETGGSLFVIINGTPCIYELDLTGKRLRKIKLKGFDDTEGITWIGGDIFAILEEGSGRIVLVNITNKTETIKSNDAVKILSSFLRKPDDSNKGWEGIAYDKSGKGLFATLENPEIWHVKNIFGNTINIMTDILKLIKNDIPSDLSGLHYDVKSQTLLLLSDESQRLYSVDMDGLDPSKTTSKNLSDKGLPQAEGVTMDDEGNIYVVSEHEFPLCLESFPIFCRDSRFLILKSK